MTVMNVVRIAKIVALLAFVLPWVAVSCNNVDVATASGIELIQGKMTENPDAEKQMGQRMGGMFGVNPDSLEAEGGFGGVRDGASTPMPELGTNYFGIAAAAVIVIGLALSFVGTGRTAARNVLVTSLLGMALVFGTVWWWKDQIKKQDGGGGENAAAQSPFGGGGNPFGGGGGMDAMGAQMADQILQERFGYWLALGALAVAAGAGALAMGGGAAGTKPDAAPPAA
jgi:uncharacterized membrane protein YgcG